MGGSPGSLAAEVTPLGAGLNKGVAVQSILEKTVQGKHLEAPQKFLRLHESFFVFYVCTK